MRTLPFICRWLKHQSFVNMDWSRQIQRWILVTATLLTSLAGMVVGLTPDGLALMEFKDGFNGTSPLLQNWNPLDTSPCSWGGINCTESGDVRSINLSAQDPMLKSNISSSLGKLKSLKVLMLDQNSLSGSIPPELGDLSSLVTLSLWMNRLSGEIPPQLGNCSSLDELWLDSNILSGNIPESLGNLKNLGEIEGRPQPIAQCSIGVTTYIQEPSISQFVPTAKTTLICNYERVNYYVVSTNSLP